VSPSPRGFPSYHNSKRRNPQDESGSGAVFGGGCGRTLRAEELSRDVEGLAADDNDLLAIEQLLRDRAGQTAEQMALRVNAIRC
jgi:hypothetical protein